MLGASSPEVRDFAAAFEENRNLTVRTSTNPGGWKGYRIVLEDRRKYIAVDETDLGDTPPYTHRSGRFLIDRETGVVYSIKGYGQRGYRLGTVTDLTAKYRAASATFDPNRTSYSVTSHSMVAETPRAAGLRVLQGGLQRRRHDHLLTGPHRARR